jgi:hypothetical protein
VNRHIIASAIVVGFAAIVSAMIYGALNYGIWIAALPIGGFMAFALYILAYDIAGEIMRARR